MTDMNKTKEELSLELKTLKQENATLKDMYEKDISGYQKVMEKLNYEKYLMNTLINNIPIHIYIKDCESRFIMVDKGSAQSFGLNDPEQVVGKTDFDFFSHEHAQQAYEDEQVIIRTGAPIIKEEKETWTDRPDTWVSTSKFPLYDKDEKIIGIFGISMDITELKQKEEKNITTNKELEKLNSEKDKLFSIIAHDLRSPFHGLLGLTEVMVKDSHEMSSEEITNYSSSLHELVVNLYSLLENLLEWAQFQKGSLAFMPKALNLSDIFSQSIDSTKQRAIQKEIIILNDIPETLKIYADEKMINSVLRNLLSNSVKFTRKNGIVVGKAREIEEGMVEISVTDTGVGIPGNTMAKLFKLGERVGSKGTANELSTGLGLVICKEFVEKNGGRIWVESKESIGSTFYFTLHNYSYNSSQEKNGLFD
jgi:PAS domain S-box-containing protein